LRISAGRSRKRNGSEDVRKGKDRDIVLNDARFTGMEVDIVVFALRIDESGS
jgi:hypothetical protein